MKIKEAGAHLDHMLRQTRVHHVQLSSMADLKANILLTMASVVISVSFRYVTDPSLKYPAMVLIVFCLITILLAAYTVMPKIGAGLKKPPHPDIHSPKFNILFFGDFVQLGYDEFESEMEDILNDPSKVYETQVREIYTLGKYLSIKKYRFVRLAYMSFITGLLISGILTFLLGLLN